MSSMEQAVKAGIVQNFYEVFEQVRCPNEACDSAIPTECVQSVTDAVSGIRTVRAYCRHCDTLWMGKFHLNAGRWDVHERVIPIANTKLRMNFKARLGKALGEVQKKG